jgi:hypothetical protein
MTNYIRAMTVGGVLFGMAAVTPALAALAHRLEYPNIRQVEIGRRNGHLVTNAQDRAYSFRGACKWQDASYLVTRWSTGDKPLSQTVPGCMSGLYYFFARELDKHFDGKVPVGIVQPFFNAE